MIYFDFLSLTVSYNLYVADANHTRFSIMNGMLFNVYA